jgi:hypothetical protein
VGEVGNQLRENRSADLHPPLFRRLNATQFKSNPIRFQLKSFFAQTSAISLMAME